MLNQPTIANVSVENFLSFRKMHLVLQPLSVLVGPNGSGKTNVLKIFQFLGDVARNDLIPAIYASGGFDDLLFRGLPVDTRARPQIRISVTGLITKHSSLGAPDEYDLRFRRYPTSPVSPSPAISLTESMVLKRTPGAGRRITLSGNTVRFEPTGNQSQRKVPAPLAVQRGATGLATLRRLGAAYDAAQVEELALVFEQLRLFEVDVEKIRRPYRFRVNETLRADGANIGPFLNYLNLEHKEQFSRICDDVRFVLPGFEQFVFEFVGGNEEAIQVSVKERHLTGTTPMARLSFGTLRCIALFAMLHDPNPPRLTCLEEIDHGLHPYALDRLVERLRDASRSTQFILATHSPALVNRLRPSELIVVERDDTNGESKVFKQDEERIAELSARTGYELGELWFSGLLGGTI